MAVFWPVLTFDFVRWDDDISITQNPLLTAPWSWALVGKVFTADEALRFKPLHCFLCRLLYEAFGFDPVAWHAFNLLLHIAAAVLFYVVLRRVYGLLATGEGKLYAEWGALLGAAVWALHPLRAEAVAWATASTYPLMAVCLLTSFVCYLEAHSSPAGTHRWLAFAWVFAVAGYATYPVSVTYGLWLMAVDRWLLPSQLEKKGLWKPGMNWAWCIKQACFLVPAFFAIGLTLWSRFTTPGIFTGAPPINSVGVISRCTMALAILTHIAWRLFWPVDLTTNNPPLSADSGVFLLVGADALFAALILVCAWRMRQRQPLLALVCLGFAALALPCLGWTERPSWPADRYSYLLHLVLIGGGTGWLMSKAGHSRRLILLIGTAVSVVLLACAIAARRQAMTWRDSTTFFTHMEESPHFADNPRQEGHIYVMWGYYEVTAARPARAAILLNKAQRVYISAMAAAVSRQDYSEALSLLTHFEHYFPLSPIMRREKGAWLIQISHYPEALFELRQAQQKMPEDARTNSLIKEAEHLTGQNAMAHSPR